ncbi:PIN domain-containing protein [Candidatus Venteria ishoeyi]|uniref:type II toxin-antitoxin system VapC family toxin n=1 Tax=Candidatus Venteria ishoeyi TaxID=1899563 RepID=UPI0025A5F207|nr:PIN domain-containing protein [Candidatus Venteria ishoeyi]MDM8547569.1 PIN domain-containing protein [Candidatus Venteria ishoeyi]
MRYQQFFNCALCLPLPETIFDMAAQLRATHTSLKTPDALHLACAQHHQCHALWTNDDRLINITHDLSINVIDKYK